MVIQCLVVALVISICCNLVQAIKHKKLAHDAGMLQVALNVALRVINRNGREITRLQENEARLHKVIRNSEYVKSRIIAEAGRWKGEAIKFETYADLCKDRLDTYTEFTDRAYLSSNWVKMMGKKALASGREGIYGRRFKVIEQEFKELRDAHYRNDGKAYLDALGDIMFACDVTCCLLSINSDVLYHRIYESNMTKDPILFERDGKGKGLGFIPPRLDEDLKHDFM